MAGHNTTLPLPGVSASTDSGELWRQSELTRQVNWLTAEVDQMQRKLDFLLEKARQTDTLVRYVTEAAPDVIRAYKFREELQKSNPQG